MYVDSVQVVSIAEVVKDTSLIEVSKLSHILNTIKLSGVTRVDLSSLEFSLLQQI